MQRDREKCGAPISGERRTRAAAHLLGLMRRIDPQSSQKGNARKHAQTIEQSRWCILQCQAVNELHQRRYDRSRHRMKQTDGTEELTCPVSRDMAGHGGLGEGGDRCAGSGKDAEEDEGDGVRGGEREAEIREEGEYE